jgi:hypothetical protein
MNLSLHNDIMANFQERKINKPSGIKKYSLYMVRVDVKDQKLQPYTLQRIRGT